VSGFLDGSLNPIRHLVGWLRHMELCAEQEQAAVASVEGNKRHDGNFVTAAKSNMLGLTM
jgi:hypothetical protein